MNSFNIPLIYILSCIFYSNIRADTEGQKSYYSRWNRETNYCFIYQEF